MMYRAYIKDIDELDYSGVPHKGHFVYGNLVCGNSNDDIDAIVGNLIEINDEYVNAEWWQSIEKGSAEQSTGLKDANGREIYEGDIVQPVSSYIHFKLGKPFEVKKESYVYGKLIARHISDDVSIVDGCYFSNEIQIIGNVHENPELLEAQHDTRAD